MSLQIGQQLGSYEITALLGKGRMGEVYRARDMKLARNVALKVLPELFAHDPDRITRFQREAQLLASLSHPNIAQIHGLEESQGTLCLVLELVEGQTLAERLNRGPLPIDEALEIAKQIADGLESAHASGIMHRDLKPANVKQTPDGKVKILDFGLAKAFEAEAQSPVSSSELATLLTGDHTQANLILGTAAYMSPEQVRGKTLDKRSDVWAFGCILYEMLAGKMAFDGESVAEMFGAIAKVDPDWNALPEGTPALIRSLLHRCLQNDRGRRLRNMGAARLEIEEVLSEPIVASSQKKNWPVMWIFSGVGIVAAFFLGILGSGYFRSVPPNPPELRLEVTPPPRT